jgi:hypothetical protein
MSNGESETEPLIAEGWKSCVCVLSGGEGDFQFGLNRGIWRTRRGIWRK